MLPQGSATYIVPVPLVVIDVGELELVTSDIGRRLRPMSSHFRPAGSVATVPHVSAGHLLTADSTLMPISSTAGRPGELGLQRALRIIRWPSRTRLPARSLPLWMPFRRQATHAIALLDREVEILLAESMEQDRWLGVNQKGAVRRTWKQLRLRKAIPPPRQPPRWTQRKPPTGTNPAKRPSLPWRSHAAPCVMCRRSAQ